jgi:hypothetical protein
MSRIVGYLTHFAIQSAANEGEMVGHNTGWYWRFRALVASITNPSNIIFTQYSRWILLELMSSFNHIF